MPVLIHDPNLVELTQVDPTAAIPASEQTFVNSMQISDLSVRYLFLLETDSHITGRALEAIAKAIPAGIEQLKEVSFQLHTDHLYCQAIGCATWSGDLHVTVQKADGLHYYKGLIDNSVIDGHMYRISLTEVVPFHAKVNLDPASNNPVEVILNENGDVSLVYAGVTHAATFNSAMNQVDAEYLENGNTHKLMIQIAKDDSGFYVPSLALIVTKSGGLLVQQLTFEFNRQGLPTFKRDESNSNPNMVSVSHYAYREINGEPKVISEISTQTMTNAQSNQVVQTIYWNKFYDYDAQGRQTIQVHVVKTVSAMAIAGNRDSAYYYYSLSEFGVPGGNRLTAANYNESSTSDLFTRIQSAADYALIEQVVKFRRIYYYHPDEAEIKPLPYMTIGEEKVSGQFVAKKVVLSSEEKIMPAFIVQGEPDVLSGESDDILFNEFQTVNGYRVSYNIAYDSQGHEIGYRLIFQKSSPQATISVPVDYPSQNMVTLDNVTYRITIDGQGKVMLEQVEPIDVQAMVQEAQAKIDEVFGALNIPESFFASELEGIYARIVAAKADLTGILTDLLNRYYDLERQRLRPGMVLDLSVPEEFMQLENATSQRLTQLYARVVHGNVKFAAANDRVIDVPMATAMYVMAEAIMGTPAGASNNPLSLLAVFKGLSAAMLPEHYSHFTGSIYVFPPIPVFTPPLGPSDQDLQGIIVKFLNQHLNDVIVNNQFSVDRFKAALINGSLAKKAKEMVLADVEKILGLGLNDGAVWLEDAIAVDLQTLQVTVDLTKLPARLWHGPNMADPLMDVDGSLPSEIRYQLEHRPQDVMEPCRVSFPGGAVTCPDPVLQLKNASFEIDGKFYELDYSGSISNANPWVNIYRIGDNRLKSVKIYDGNPHIVCITTPCPTGQLAKEVSYLYINNNGSDVPDATATIVYHKRGTGDVAARIVELKYANTYGPYYYQVNNITDYTAGMAEVLAITHVAYSPDYKISRYKPATGELLSETVYISDNYGVDEAILRVNGKDVRFNFSSLEDFLNKARRYEQDESYVDLVDQARQDIDQLLGRLEIPERIDTVELSMYYQIIVSWKNLMVGILAELKLKLNQLGLGMGETPYPQTAIALEEYAAQKLNEAYQKVLYADILFPHPTISEPPSLLRVPMRDIIDFMRVNAGPAGLDNNPAYLLAAFKGLTAEMLPSRFSYFTASMWVLREMPGLTPPLGPSYQDLQGIAIRFIQANLSKLLNSQGQFDLAKFKTLLVNGPSQSPVLTITLGQVHVVSTDHVDIDFRVTNLPAGANVIAQYQLIGSQGGWTEGSLTWSSGAVEDWKASFENLMPNTKYRYRILVVNAAGKKLRSKSGTFKTKPVELALTQVNVLSPTAAKVNFSVPALPPGARLVVQYKRSSGGEWLNASIVRDGENGTAVFNGLMPKTKYRYQILVVDETGKVLGCLRGCFKTKRTNAN